jgi:hypothetical protein
MIVISGGKTSIQSPYEAELGNNSTSLAFDPLSAINCWLIVILTSSWRPGFASKTMLYMAALLPYELNTSTAKVFEILFTSTLSTQGFKQIIMPLLPLFIQPFKTLRLPAPDSFGSQTVIITGSNTGIGLETARRIVSLGASKVILGIRTLSKGLSAKANMESSTGRTGVVEVWELDLESFASVKAFPSRAGSLGRLDTRS